MTRSKMARAALTTYSDEQANAKMEPPHHLGFVVIPALRFEKSPSAYSKAS
jgi:hypothetical protein